MFLVTTQPWPICFSSLLACAPKRRVKTRDDHDGSLMFEVICSQRAYLHSFEPLKGVSLCLSLCVGCLHVCVFICVSELFVKMGVSLVNKKNLGGIFAPVCLPAQSL